MSNIVSTNTTNIPLSREARMLIADARLRRNYNFVRQLPKDYSTITPSEDKINREAVVMLTLIAAAHYFTDDLVSELSAHNIYRQVTKRAINRVEPIINTAHRRASDMLRACNQDNGYRAYNDCMDDFYHAIDEAVLLDAPERAYNIILAICRLVGNYVEQRIGAYDFAPAHDVAKIPAIIADVPVEDHHIDNIIDRVIRPIIFRIK